MKIRSYIALARIDHWIKNMFLIPGSLVAIFVYHYETPSMLVLLIGMLSVCFVASGNYVLNEWLDREFDKFHPVKCNRPSTGAGLSARIVYLEYILLMGVGLGIAALINLAFLCSVALLFIMGLIYNVRPVRSKDKPYVDVLSESLNNPIRLLMGWFLVAPFAVPPSSLIISYWMGGAFLMAMKRYSEYRFIDSPSTAGLYRKSFQYYDGDKLLISAFFYSICSAFFGAVFMMKHKLELIFLFPLLSLLFAWYFKLALLPDSPVQAPEKLYKNKGLMVFVAFIGALFVILLHSRMSWLDFLVAEKQIWGPK